MPEAVKKVVLVYSGGLDTSVILSWEDGTPVADLTRIGALEPDLGDGQELGWTEREEYANDG